MEKQKIKSLKNTISLSEAAKLCDLTPDNLNWLARQKKLKAIKIGRNWITTREWLNDYLKTRDRHYNNNNSRCNNNNSGSGFLNSISAIRSSKFLRNFYLLTKNFLSIKITPQICRNILIMSSAVAVFLGIIGGTAAAAQIFKNFSSHQNSKVIEISAGASANISSTKNNFKNFSDLPQKISGRIYRDLADIDQNIHYSILNFVDGISKNIVKLAADLNGGAAVLANEVIPIIEDNITRNAAQAQIYLHGLVKAAQNNIKNFPAALTTLYKEYSQPFNGSQFLEAYIDTIKNISQNSFETVKKFALNIKQNSLTLNKNLIAGSRIVANEVLPAMFSDIANVGLNAVNYSINGAARVVGNVKYFVNRSANQIVGASDLAKSIFQNTNRAIARGGEFAWDCIVNGFYIFRSGQEIALAPLDNLAASITTGIKSSASAAKDFTVLNFNASRASLVSLLGGVNNAIRDSVLGWLGIKTQPSAITVASTTQPMAAVSASNLIFISVGGQSSTGENQTSAQTAVNPPVINNYYQPIKEVKTVNTVQTVIADQETKNQVAAMLTLLNSDRPNFSLGQPTIIPSNLATKTLAVSSGDFSVDADGNVAAASVVSNGNIYGKGNLTVEGNFAINGDFVSAGASVFNASSTQAILTAANVGAGPALLADNIAIKGSTISTRDTDTAILINPNGAGAVQFHTVANYIDTDGNFVLDGDITLTSGGAFYTTDNGNLVFAPNGTGDLIVGEAGNTAKIIPFADSEVGYDLGAAAARWYDIYAKGKLDVDETALTKNQLSFIQEGKLTTGANKNLILQPGENGKTRITNGADFVDIADGMQALYAVKGATTVKLADGTWAIDAAGDIKLSGNLTVVGGKINLGADSVIDNETSHLLKLTTAGAAQVVLGDTAGINKFHIADKNGNNVFSIDSQGKIISTGTVIELAANEINLRGAAPIINSANGVLAINTANNQPVTFGGGNITIPNLYVTNYQQNNGTFDFISANATSSVFAISDNNITSGTLMSQTLTANAGNGQTSYGQIINLADNTAGGGGWTALAINTSGSGAGSGGKYLLDLNPGTNKQVVFDSNGAFRPTISSATNTNTIGSPDYYWKTGYFDTVTANNLAGTITTGATSASTFTIGSTETGDSNKALIFQCNSGSGNAILQWNSGGGDSRYLTVNYPFGAIYTVDDSSIGKTVNLFSGLLTNNTSDGTQTLLSLTNTGSGLTEKGIYINNTGTGTTALEIGGSWTKGIVTNNNSINAGSGTIQTTGTISSPESRAAKGWFTDLDVANTIVGSINGNAATATALQTSRKINGVDFNGTTDITIPVNNTNDASTNGTMYPLWTETQGGNYAAKTSNNFTYNPLTGTLSALAFSGSGAALTNLTAGNLTGTIPSGVLGNSSMYIGTTQQALNRASAPENLSGITGLTPGSDFTLTQNGIAALTSVESGAVADTLYLKAGNVGIGTIAPTAALSVGSTSQFQVNSDGAIAAATGITSSGTINFSGLNASQVIMTDASKNLVTYDYLNQAVKTTSTPTFAGLTISSLSGVLKANSGVVSGSAAASDLSNGVTGSGNIVLATSPTLTNPTLGNANITKISNLTTNGFIKTSGGDGTLTVDTNTYLTGNQTITLSGDVTGSGATSITTTLANSGVGVGTYRSVTVDVKGRVTSGANPTTFSGYGISDTSTNLAAVINDETGSGSLVFATNPTLSGLTMADNTNMVLNTTTGTKIGTAATQKLGFYNAAPIVQPSGNALTALSNLGLVSSPSLAKSDVGLSNVENTALSTWIGSTNITTLGTIGTGTWNATAIADAKIANALTGKTYNGLTLTGQATGFTITGGTTPKTLTVDETSSLSSYALLAGRAGGQTLIGGTAANNLLTLQANSATGNTLTNSAIQMKVGDSGGTTALTISNNGNVGIGTTSPAGRLTVRGDSSGGVAELIRLENLGTAAAGTGNKLSFINNITGGTATVFGEINLLTTNIDAGAFSGALQLKIASNGTLETIAEFGNPNIVFNRPMEVNVAGDVGIDYNLVFTSAGVSQILSGGPLTIAAGDINRAENLTLTTRSNEEVGDSGTATSATAATLVDSSKSWTNDEWIDGTVTIIAGAGNGQTQTITDNDATSVTVAAWDAVLGQPAANSVYRLNYASGGDVLVNVANSNNLFGGFKILGNDNGGYAFRVGPDGDVYIGGEGAAGSDLFVKQNITTYGGIMSLRQLAISAAAPEATTAVSGGSCADSTTYYYKITAINDNGETTGSTQFSITTGASGSNINLNSIAWSTVSGAVGYKIYRSTENNDWDADANDVWVDGKVIAAPAVNYDDNCSGDTASQAPPSVNTTGGKLAINTAGAARRLEVLENTSATPQIRWTSDTYNYAEWYVNAGGDLFLNLNENGSVSGGQNFTLLDQNLKVCTGGTFGSNTCPTSGFNINGTGNLVVAGQVAATDYQRICPDGYIWVPGSAKYGTLPGFCVMKYEAKCARSIAGSDCSTSFDVPVSQVANSPWRVNISQENARLACQRIGAGYHLISEAEWMTIAENIAATPINDIDSGAGLQLATGHTDNYMTFQSNTGTATAADATILTDSSKNWTVNQWKNMYAYNVTTGKNCYISSNAATTITCSAPITGGWNIGDSYRVIGPLPSLANADPVVSGCNLSLPASDVSNAYAAGSCEIRGNGSYSEAATDKGYYGTGNNFGQAYSAGEQNKSQNRVLVLSNGNTIWDIAGNVWEWTDKISICAEHPYSLNATTTSQWMEYNLSAGINYQGFSYLRPADDGWSSANGIGRIYTNVGGTASATRAFQRGGDWYYRSSAGVFALHLGFSPAITNVNIGFRCAR